MRVGRAGASLLKQILGARRELSPPFSSATLEQDDIAIVRQLLDGESSWFDRALLEEFEARFASVVGAAGAFAFGAGRFALSAILEVLGIGDGDEVVVPGYTCVVVPNAVRFAGAQPVYADIELDTYGLSVESVAQAMSEKTKAIVIHHLYGLVCRDYEELLELGRIRNVHIVEDAAQALGARYKGVHVGLRGVAGFFSTERSKIITTGQGGIAVTQTPWVADGLAAVADRARAPSREWVHMQLEDFLIEYLRKRHSKRWITREWAKIRFGRGPLISTTEMEMEGERPRYYGARMAGAIAAVGSNQLGKLDEMNSRRRRTAEYWEKLCRAEGHGIPEVIRESDPVFLRFPVLVEPDQKRDTRWAWSRYGIHVGQWYETPIHPTNQPVCGCPNATIAADGCVNFPTLGVHEGVIRLGGSN